MITKIPPYRRNYQRDERAWFAATATVKETNKRASLLKYQVDHKIIMNVQYLLSELV